MKTCLAAVLIVAIALPPAALASPRVNPVLLHEVKAMRASIDSGEKAGTDAVAQFVESMLDQGVTSEDILTYARAQMTPAEFVGFQRELDVSLHGIDPSTINPDEFSEVLARALSTSRSQGLSWSSCSKTYIGIAVLAAAATAAVIAILKNKIKTEIVHHTQQIDHIAKELSDEEKQGYEKRRQNNHKFWEDSRNLYRTGADKNAQDARNWQSAYPARIQSDQDEIVSYNRTITNKKDELDRLTRLAFLSEGDARQAYLDQMKTLSDDITRYQGYVQSDQDDIVWRQAKIELFKRDPGAVDQTIEQIYVTRDENLARADQWEANSLASINEDEQWWTEHFGKDVNHPEIIESDETVVHDTRALAKKLGIGAGVAGAVGGFLLVRGLGECR